jgi:hypothetical protein
VRMSADFERSGGRWKLERWISLSGEGASRRKSWELENWMGTWIGLVTNGSNVAVHHRRPASCDSDVCSEACDKR